MKIQQEHLSRLPSRSQETPIAYYKVNFYFSHIIHLSEKLNIATTNRFPNCILRARDGNWSGRPAGRVAGRVEILRPAGQAG